MGHLLVVASQVEIIQYQIVKDSKCPNETFVHVLSNSGRRLPFWSLVAGPRAASRRLGAALRGGAGLRAGEGRGSSRLEPAPERARVRVGAREQARGRTGPGPSAPRHVRSAGGGKRGALGSRAALHRLPGPAAPAWAAPVCGHGEAGGVQAKGGGGGGGGRRPDRRERQGKLSARRRAAPVAKPPLPARLAGALLSLALSLSLPLPGSSSATSSGFGSPFQGPLRRAEPTRGSLSRPPARSPGPSSSPGGQPPASPPPCSSALPERPQP